MAAKEYFVRFTGAKKKGPTKRKMKEVYGPYTLKSAKDYARIASQHGDPTEVFKSSGQMVRRYVGGQRQWPVRPTDAARLPASERPRRLGVGGAGGSVQVRVRHVKPGTFTLDPVSPKHDQRIRWALAESLGHRPSGPLAVVSSFPGAEEVPIGSELHLRIPAEELQQLADATHGTSAYRANPGMRVGRRWYPEG